MDVITLDGDKVAPAQGMTWDYIANKRVGDPPEEGQPDTRATPSKPTGIKIRPYQRAHAVQCGRGRKMNAAVASPKIAAALGAPSRFFVTDGNGAAKDPEFPMRMFL